LATLATHGYTIVVVVVVVIISNNTININSFVTIYNSTM